MNRLANNLVLVTGATGFIGRALVDYLLDHQVCVRVLVRQYSSLFPASVEQHIGDLTHPHTLVGVAHSVHTVFHLGGYAHDITNHHDAARKHQQINLHGTKHLLSECLASSVKKFIFFSSIKAASLENESRSPYGETKHAAEQLILEAAHTHALSVCILRLPLVYGISLKGNLYQLLRMIDKWHVLPLPAIANCRSLVSVPDVCQASWLAANHEQANGRIYYVTDQKHYSTYEIYTLMQQALGYDGLRWSLPLWFFKGLSWLGDKMGRIVGSSMSFNSSSFNKLFADAWYDATAIQIELGFQPQYTLKTLLPSIVAAYRRVNSQ